MSKKLSGGAPSSAAANPLTSLLDADGDRSVIDEVLGMFLKW